MKRSPSPLIFSHQNVSEIRRFEDLRKTLERANKLFSDDGRSIEGAFGTFHFDFCFRGRNYSLSKIAVQDIGIEREDIAEVFYRYIGIMLEGGMILTLASDEREELEEISERNRHTLASQGVAVWVLSSDGTVLDFFDTISQIAESLWTELSPARPTE